MKLSAIVITKNEAVNIADCLQQLAFADERIVIDGESSDDTAEIARKNGATVIVNPWPGYGAQKNLGMQKAQGDWVLFIDADERVTAQLAAEIKRVIIQANKDFYWLKIVTVFLNKPLFHLYGHNPRLFRKGKGAWTENFVHEQVQHTETKKTITLGDDVSEVLREPLLHNSHPTIASYLTKMNHYTALDAQNMAATNKHRSGRPVAPSFLLPWQLLIRQFGKMYFYRKGFLDGWAGFMWCLLSAYYEYVMAQKYQKLIGEKNV